MSTEDHLKKAAKKAAKKSFNAFYTALEDVLTAKAADTSTPLDDIALNFVLTNNTRKAVWRAIKKAL